MYAGTIFEIEDRSDIASLITAETIDMPIEMIGFTSDRGTEDFVYVDGDVFFDQYGDISFAKHGQPLLQAANAINNGARLFCKRVVASDSTLANNGVVGYVSTETTQKTDDDGNLLYTDADTGQETTDAQTSSGTDNSPVMQTKCKITYNTVSIANYNSSSMSDLYEQFVAQTTDGYPLFIIADVGRGASDKRVRINPDYNISRTYEYVKYIVYVDEDNDTLDQFQCTLNPDTISVDENINIQTASNNRDNKQIRVRLCESAVKEFVAKIEDVLVNQIGVDEDEVEDMDLINQDLLFGCTYKGADLYSDYITVDTETALNSLYGIALLNGDNGSFGDYPIESSDYSTEMVKVFNGEFSDDIYNVDNNPVDLIIDANYSNSVKRAIEDLVAFREDISYLRDLAIESESTGERTPCRSIDEIEYADAENTKSRYCSTYCTWYDIYDPYTYKQITVSIGYSLARLIVSHFVNGRSRPLCGIKYGITIPEAIAGTVNFIPKITPAGNQKTTLEDLRINYACYLDGTFTIETCYTSQEKFTQLSYSNNVFNIQQIIHEIRKKCPKIRYTFMDGDDFDAYQQEINSLLAQYSTNFMSLTMEYVEDSVYASNKIYYAVIYVQFRNFVQTEMFKIVALQS